MIACIITAAASTRATRHGSIVLPRAQISATATPTGLTAIVMLRGRSASSQAPGEPGATSASGAAAVDGDGVADTG